MGSKVCQKTKDLEKETEDWQGKWAESNASLTKMEQSYVKLQADLERAHEGLNTMTNLCKALQKERTEMLKELKREEK
jgi:septal ring factor EnvC (AmiA/AmiB activator)